MTTGTYADTHATIHRLALESFAEHELREVSPQRWRCSRPGTGVYGFWVLVADGVVIVYGDIGEGIFRMSEPAASVIPWLRGAVQSTDYLLEKLRAGDFEQGKEQFYPDDAVAWAHWNAEEHTEQDRYAKRALDFYNDVKLSAENGDLHSDEFLRLASEAGLDDMYHVGRAPSASALWLVEALTTFIRLIDAKESADGVHAPATQS